MALPKNQRQQNSIWARNGGNIRSQEEQEKVWARNGGNIKDSSTRPKAKGVNAFPVLRASPDIYQAGGKKNSAALNVVKQRSTASYVYVRINPGMVGTLQIDATDSITITKLQTQYVWLHLVFSDMYQSEPSSYSVGHGASVPENKGANAYLTLATIVKGGKITNNLSGSVGCHFCSPDLLLWKL